jgi:uncharacterized protein YndB with AHSA1/START domain
MSSSRSDRIEKTTVLRAPRSRVWLALTDAKQFGEWFGMAVQGRFDAGTTVRCAIVGGPYDGFVAPLVVDRVEPESLFSFRWHPYAVEKDVDYSSEPMTLVTFELSDAPAGTQLRIVESGFDAIPEARRAKARLMNDGGWTEQLRNIARHVDGAA